MSSIYLSIRPRTPLVGDRCRRKRAGRPAGSLLAAVIIIIGALSGCSSTEPVDPGIPSQSPTGTPSPASSTMDASTSSRSTATATTTTEPPGTVVPFRTVTPDSAVGQRIGLIASTGSNPFSKAVTDSIVATAQAAGAELISCDPGANTTLMLDCAQRLATQQVEGWIIVQPDDAGEALCAAGPQDVPLIAIAAPPASCETAEVGADDERAGFLVGTELGRTAVLRSGCPDDTLVIITNGATPTASTQRTEGIRAGFSSQCNGSPANEILFDAATQDSAYQAVTKALTALPDDADILLAAVDDGAALGAAAAIPDARADHVTMAAIGADQRARCEIVVNPRWIGDAALFPDRYGEVAVPALLDALQGQEIPRNMFIETTFITADSLGTYYDISNCPGR